MILSGSTEQIEILDLDSKMTCLTESSTFKFGQGGLVDDQTVLLCDTSTSGECFHFGTNGYDKTPFKIQLRTFDAIGIMVENQVSGQSYFWITGGKVSNTLTDTTEIVSLTESKAGVALPFSVYKHCLVKVNR